MYGINRKSTEFFLPCGGWFTPWCNAWHSGRGVAVWNERNVKSFHQNTALPYTGLSRVDFGYYNDKSKPTLISETKFASKDNTLRQNGMLS